MADRALCSDKNLSALEAAPWKYVVATPLRRSLKKAEQAHMSVERIRDALTGVQASILEHANTGAKYRMPSAFSHDASRIYRAFGLSRSISPSLA